MKLILILIFVFFPALAFAQELDTDNDGISDYLEINRYYTNPSSLDTDGDGIADNHELLNGFSPNHAVKRLIEVDSDSDGLSDGYELALKTNIKNPDSDGDGFRDGHEFANGYDPASPESKKLEKSIVIDLSEQRLWHKLGPVILHKYVISTGKASTPTPVGNFQVQNKIDRPFSKTYGLFMPNWLGLGRGYGIHELPEWPGGHKEGADHLGIPVSHGCIRLSPEGAEALYSWSEVGTPVIIQS